MSSRFGPMDVAQRKGIYAAGLLAAITLGVLLGNSTISAIDPVHFRGAAPHPRQRAAAIASDTPPLGLLYSRDEALSTRAGLCPGCGSALQAETVFYSTPVPYFGSREERVAADAHDRRTIDESYASGERRREEEALRRTEAAARVDESTQHPETAADESAEAASFSADDVADETVQE